MENCQVPACEVRDEIVIMNSRFIATLAPVFDIDSARAFIKRVREEFPGANHHVSAYLVGCGTSVTAYRTDDGEPSGTAGRPALAVLQGSGLSDVAVVVSRFFGGTKLGAGGLVRAYTEAVKKVVLKVPRARLQLTRIISMSLPYPIYERVRQSVDIYRGAIIDQVFGAEVVLTVQFAVEDYEPFEHHIRELSSGRIKPVVVSTEKQIRQIQTNA